jgi:hypothetical protein
MGTGTHPSSYTILPEGSLLGIKRPGREAYYSSPSSAAVKNVWSYTSISQYVFIMWCLIKRRDRFTFFYQVDGQTWPEICAFLLRRK